MTSLSPADAERLTLAFQKCRDMPGTLREQLDAYAAAGREIFPAYAEATKMAAQKMRRVLGTHYRPSSCLMKPAGWSS